MDKTLDEQVAEVAALDASLPNDYKLYEWRNYWQKSRERDGEADCGVTTVKGHSVVRCPKYMTQDDWLDIGGFIVASSKWPALIATLHARNKELEAQLAEAKAAARIREREQQEKV